MSRVFFDAIVIGSGPGGASVSFELAKRGMKVLILERGGSNKRIGTLLNFVSKAGLPFRNLFLTKNKLIILRAITLGGSGFFNYATAKDPSLDLFLRYGVDISSALSSVRNELPIGKLSPDLIGPKASMIHEAASSIGIGLEPLEKMIFQSLCRRGCDLCTYGCPFQAKWHPGLWIEKACELGADISDNSHVSKVLYRRNKAYGVVFRRFGVEHFAYSPKIIISAGGIGSPIILRESGLHEVGNKLFVDPVISVMGQVERKFDSGKEMAMVYGYHNHDYKYIISDLALPSALQHLFSSLVGRFSSPEKTLSMMVKSTDNMEGKINARGYPEKNMTSDDLFRLNHGCLQAESILEAAGATKIFRTRPFAAHPGGTVAIGTHLDAELQTRISGLYVCDASVIPEPWGLPPTLSLLALGRYLSGHIR